MRRHWLERFAASRVLVALLVACRRETLEPARAAAAFAAQGQRLWAYRMTTRRWKQMAVGLSITVLLWAVWSWVPLVPFECVYYCDRGPLSSSWDRAQIHSSAQATRILAMLDRYGEPYWRVGSQVVLVPLSLAFDTELVWNYTSKDG